MKRIFAVVIAMLGTACGPGSDDVVTRCDIPPFASVEFEYEVDCDAAKQEFELARRLLTDTLSDKQREWWKHRTEGYRGNWTLPSRIIHPAVYDGTFKDTHVRYREKSTTEAWGTWAFGYCDVTTNTVWLGNHSYALPHELRHRWGYAYGGEGVFTAFHPGWIEGNEMNLELAFQEMRYAKVFE